MAEIQVANHVHGICNVKRTFEDIGLVFAAEKDKASIPA